jgi:hypothetical protein
MRSPDADYVTPLIAYSEAAEIAGRNRLNAAIADGHLRPIKLNGRSGAPSMFLRSIITQLGGAREVMGCVDCCVAQEHGQLADFAQVCRCVEPNKAGYR